MANVALLFGTNKTLYLKEETIDKKSYIGANELNTMVLKLAEHNPQNNYFVIGLCGDYKRLDEEGRNKLPKNLKFFLYDNDLIINDFSDKDYVFGKLNEMVSKLKEINIDYGIMYGGLISNHLPFTVYKKDGTLGKLLVSQCRQAYSAYAINNIDFPYINWNSDDRFLINAKNIINHEKCCLGMESTIINKEVLVDLSKESQMNNIVNNVEIPVIYDGSMDTFMLCTKNFSKEDRETIKIENKKGMCLFINPSKDYDRFKDIEEFILNNEFEDDFVEIYGNWKDIEDYRFKGALPHKESMAKLNNSKYTMLIASHYKNRKTPITVKFWECVYSKVIPFMNDMYGSEEFKKTHNIPDFFWIKNKEELKEKIDMLENNNEKYLEVLNMLETLFKEEYLSFEHVNKKMKNNLERYCDVKW